MAPGPSWVQSYTEPSCRGRLHIQALAGIVLTVGLCVGTSALWLQSLAAGEPTEWSRELDSGQTYSMLSGCEGLSFPAT